MRQSIAATVPRLTYASAAGVYTGVGEASGLESLSHASPSGAVRRWPRPLADHDHLVLAESRVGREPLGVLGAIEGRCGNTTLLKLETVQVSAGSRSVKLLARMIAFGILRVARNHNDSEPRAIVAQTSRAALYQAFAILAERVPGAVLYPDRDDRLVSLETARLARTMMRGRASSGHFLPATGTVLAGRLAGDCCGGTEPLVPQAAPEFEALFASRLGALDQMLLVLDLRAPKERTLFDALLPVYRTR
jgi:hypothetical protein